MYPSPSECVLIANPGSRREVLFQQALAGLGRPPARVLAYADILRGLCNIAGQISPDALVKIDSPGKDFEVERLILSRGGVNTEQLAYRKGEILWPAAWFGGFSAVMDDLLTALQRAPKHRLMNDPSDARLMFDKPACHRLLEQSAIPVPKSLPGPILSHAELLERMSAARMPRVFVKLAYGSSGSGVIAYQIKDDRQRATTTVEMQSHNGTVRLFNSRKIRTYTDSAAIKQLIDTLCAHGVHVEAWIPKASVGGKAIDLRIVCLAGQPRFFVVRSSVHPITNLHLLNQRGDVDQVRQRFGAARWEQMLHTCRQICRLFPRSLSVAIDMLIRADWRAHAVLELNAFGDLLPGITDGRHDIYTAQILASAPRPAEVAA